MLIPVILSGGAGSRLWPVSREAHPKPFMKMPDGKTLLQKTLARAQALPDVQEILTTTNREYYFQTRDEYFNADTPNVDIKTSYILEPEGRNTAPAIAMAARYILQNWGNEAVMLVLAADHIIENQVSFQKSVASATLLARQGKLVTFGINPDRAETAYGYIQVGDLLSVDQGFAVKQFVEKPDKETAEKYLAAGDYVWNSGMFCFRPQVFLDELARLQPEMSAQLDLCWGQTEQASPFILDRETFGAIQGQSIDYAVMEKSQQVAVVRCDFDWNDVGSWDAIADLSDTDMSGNGIVGEAMMLHSTNCYVHSSDRLIVALGLEQVMIVDTPDALLVAHKDKAQEVKQVVATLKSQQHEAFRYHSTVHRPWGSYTVLETGDRFKIKRIVVKPEASLSLQMHYHRSEHWVVVQGTAEVINGDKTFLVHTNESTFVPAGNKHRLSNPGVVELVMIEVQSGEYLEEDDIVRFDDVYGREDEHAENSTQ